VNYWIQMQPWVLSNMQPPVTKLCVPDNLYSDTAPYLHLWLCTLKVFCNKMLEVTLGQRMISK
jgi:hypothetical protein